MSVLETNFLRKDRWLNYWFFMYFRDCHCLTTLRRGIGRTDNFSSLQLCLIGPDEVWASPILAMASESNHLRSDGQFIFVAKGRNLACFSFHLIWRSGLSYLCFVNGLCIYVPRSHQSGLPDLTCQSLTVIILYLYPASKTSISFDDDQRQATNDVARLAAIDAKWIVNK